MNGKFNPGKNSTWAFRGAMRNLIDMASCDDSTYENHLKRKHTRVGNKNPASRLTESQVKDIRKKWDAEYNNDNGLELMKQITRQYPVSSHTIRSVVQNKAWQSVTLCENPYVSKQTRKRYEKV